jgi:hypothetical protein
LGLASFRVQRWIHTSHNYWPIDGFAKVEIVEVLQVEATTYIYWPIDGFAKVEFFRVF